MVFDIRRAALVEEKEADVVKGFDINRAAAVPVYSSEVVPESVNPLGGNAGMQLASYLGIGPQAEKKTVTLPDGSVQELTRAAELEKAYDYAMFDLQEWGMFSESVFPSGVYVDANGVEMSSIGEFGIDRVGGHYASAEERYGSDFMNLGAGSAERNSILRQRRKDGLDQGGEHALTQAAQEVAGVDPTMGFVGTLVKKTLTPTVLAPIGKSIPAMMGLGGLVLGQMEAAEQLSGGKERNLANVAKYTAAGSMFGPFLGAPIRTTKGIVTSPLKAKQVTQKAIKRMINKSNAKKLGPDKANRVSAANNIAVKIQREMDEQIVKGVPQGQTLQAAQNALEMTDQQVLDALFTATVKPQINSQKQAILNLTRRTNPLESTSAIGKGIDALTSSITYTIEKIHKPLVRGLRHHDLTASVNTARSRKKIEPVLNSLDKLQKLNKNDPAKRALLDEFAGALRNGQTGTTKRIANEHFPELASQLVSQGGKKAPIRILLDDVHARANQAGIKIPYIADFMPRVVKNIKDFRIALGTKNKSAIDKALTAKAVKLGLKSGDELSDDAQAAVINEVFLRQSAGRDPKRAESSRVIDQIAPELQEFYEDIGTSLVIYIDRLERQIAKNNFFGANKAAHLDAQGNLVLMESIGELLKKEVQTGNLDLEQVDQLRSLLVSRFDMGEKAMSGGWATLRDLQTMSLLAQFRSAGTQFGDLGSSMVVNGFANTIKAMSQGRKTDSVTGKAMAASTEDIGLLNRVAAEYEQAGGKTQKVADMMMTAVGFRHIDAYGKNTFIRASLLKAQSLAKKDPAEFIRKYGEYYGKETKQLIEDLNNNVMSDNVKLHLWSELAEVQPISLSEMPQVYLNHPNGRLLYSMKTFGLKQLNFIRKNIIDKFRAGETKEGMEMAMRYTMFMGTMGLGVQEAKTFIASGFDEDALKVDTSSSSALFQSLPIEFGEALLKTVFLNKYDREKYLEEGDLAGWVLAQATPASAGVLSTAGKAGISLLSGEGYSKEVQKATRLVPLAGDPWNLFINGGMEKIAEDNIKNKESSNRRKREGRSRSDRSGRER